MELMNPNFAAAYSDRQDETALADVIAAIMIGLYLTNIASGIGRFFGITAPMISFASKILILAALLRCLAIFISRLNWTILISTFVFALVTVIQQAFFPDNIQYLHGINGTFTDSTFFTFLVTVLPAIYTISVIRDFDILLRRLQGAAFLLSGFTAFVLAVYGGEAFEKYSMGFAGAMILPTTLMILKTVEKQENIWKNIISVCFSLVDVFSVAMYGSRGAFVAIVGFAVYYFLWGQIKRRRLSAILSAIVFLVFSVNYKTILKAIDDWALSLGFYSRTLISLSSEKVSDSGRSNGYKIIMEIFRESPFQIRGVNADYNVLGVYCHNWFLELLFSFGILFGGIACAMMIFMMVKTLLRDVSDSVSKMLACLIFAFFPVCLVSGSIWLSTWFWCWVTLYFRARSKYGSRV